MTTSSIYSYSPIRHEDISAAQMVHYSNCMVRGNTILKSYCNRFRAAIGILECANFGGDIEELRQRLFYPPSHRFYLPHISVGITNEQFKEIDILRNIVLSPALIGRKNLAYNRLRSRYDILLPLMSDEERQAVQDVAKIADRVVAGFINLIKRISRKFDARCNSVVDKEDLNQVGLTALYDAVYGYTDPQYMFITYAGRVMFRRMTRTLAGGSDFSNLINGSEKIIAAFHRVVLTSQEHISFDEIVEQMKIKTKDNEGVVSYRSPTTKEIEKMRCIFCRFLRGSDMQESSDDEWNEDSLSQIADPIDDGIDFEAMNFSDILSRVTLNSEDQKVLDAASAAKHDKVLARRARKIQSTKLSKAELELLRMAQTGKRGFKSRWAKRHKTSRTWAAMALKVATSKIDSLRHTLNAQQQGLKP